MTRRGFAGGGQARYPCPSPRPSSLLYSRGSPVWELVTMNQVIAPTGGPRLGTASLDRPLIQPLSDSEPTAEAPAMRILLVEDNKPLARSLRQGLEEEGYSVDQALDGDEADVKARATGYDVIILDVMLPKVDGLTLLQNWRKDGLKAHVLMLTARTTVDDKVKGLDAG